MWNIILCYMKCAVKNEHKLVCLKYNNTCITLVTIAVFSVICLLRLKEQLRCVLYWWSTVWVLGRSLSYDRHMAYSFIKQKIIVLKSNYLNIKSMISLSQLGQINKKNKMPFKLTQTKLQNINMPHIIAGQKYYCHLYVLQGHFLTSGRCYIIQISVERWTALQKTNIFPMFLLHLASLIKISVHLLHMQIQYRYSR
jgi:hypothetical protein